MVGQALVYIRPLQKDIDVQSLELGYDQSISSGPLTECLYCNEKYSLSEMPGHVDVCEKLYERDRERLDDDDAGQEGTSVIVAESNTERQDRVSASVSDGPSTSHCSTAEFAIEEWKMEPDLDTAAKMYRRHILRNAEEKPDVVVTLDVHASEQDREREMLTFYKRQNLDWTSPFSVRFKGDAAMGDGVTRHFFSLLMDKLHFGFDIDLDNCGKTLLFNGEDDHKVPSTSRALVDGDLFRVVGRMIGHTFIHGGPLFSGLSPSLLPLLSGSKDAAPILELKDCPDIDVANIVTLLESQSELSPQEKDSLNKQPGLKLGSASSHQLEQKVVSRSCPPPWGYWQT
ncbi:uncharacterized protein LOC143504293 [Brachyhypopomus gauderio]|uniref:uncharacterized protein LOC143482278 n=1 Tax=Brachyhypopomus gauderio TaxID=698409 RepID=UPI004042D1D9